MPFRNPFGSFADYGSQQQDPNNGLLSLSDVYQDQPDYPEVPQPNFVTDFSQLPDNHKRNARNLFLMQLAKAIGQGTSDGRLGEHLAEAAMSKSQIEDQQTQEYRKQQADDYSRQVQNRNSNVALLEKTRAAKSNALRAQQVLDVANGIIQKDPTKKELARALAGKGDLENLQKLDVSAEEDAFYKLRGLDPSDKMGIKFAEEAGKGQIDTAESVNKHKILSPLEIADKIKEEEELKKHKLGRYDPSTHDNVNIYPPQLVQGQDGNYYLADKNTGVMHPVTGAPPALGELDKQAMEMTKKQQTEFESSLPAKISGQKFDFDSAYKKNLKDIQSAVKPKQQTSPAISGAGAASPRIDSPQGAPLGAIGTGGAPGTGSEHPAESVNSFVQSLPPKARFNPNLAIKVQKLRDAGVPEQEILRQLKDSYYRSLNQ